MRRKADKTRAQSEVQSTAKFELLHGVPQTPATAGFDKKLDTGISEFELCLASMPPEKQYTCSQKMTALIK